MSVRSTSLRTPKTLTFTAPSIQGERRHALFMARRRRSAYNHATANSQP